MQATPFCNIDCDYCYLSTRDDKAIMSRDVLLRTFDRVFALPNLGRTLTIVWHGGEPLAAPISFYDFAYSAAKRAEDGRCEAEFCFQTNGTLIDSSWCEFFRKTNSHVGISLDGPAYIHDRQRKKRSGTGTYSLVERGIDTLNAQGVPFYIITVISEETLPFPVELYNFIKRTGCTSWGINIEALEGVNQRRSFSGQCRDNELSEFIRKLFATWLDDRSRIHIREFDGLIAALTRGHSGAPQETNPLAIINVDVNGGFSTFSPELLGAQTPHGRFIFGNVLTDSFDSTLNNPVYRAASHSIDAGIDACRRSCEYFAFCGGGTPSSKLYETGRFDVTETRSCRTRKIIVIDEVLRGLEEKFGLPAFGEAT